MWAPPARQHARCSEKWAVVIPPSPRGAGDLGSPNRQRLNLRTGFLLRRHKYSVHSPRSLATGVICSLLCFFFSEAPERSYKNQEVNNRSRLHFFLIFSLLLLLLLLGGLDICCVQKKKKRLDVDGSSDSGQ